MTPALRRREILNYIKRKHAVSIKELSRMLKVSSMTIRRDLAYFANQGIVSLTYGGAMFNKGAATTDSVLEKQKHMNSEKKRIGSAAAQLVKDGDTVFLDCGTTTKEIADCLVGKKNLVVITNSLLAANSLVMSKKNTLLMVPGVFNNNFMGFTGGAALDFMDDIQIDYAFLSTEGIHHEFGATVSDINDWAIKKKVAGKGTKTVIVADHTKIGKKFMMTSVKPEEINIIITDNKADKNALELFTDKYDEVIVV